jgi:hypothetical protein
VTKRAVVVFVATIKVKLKLKLALEQATKAQRGSTGIAVLFY